MSDAQSYIFFNVWLEMCQSGLILQFNLKQFKTLKKFAYLILKFTSTLNCNHGPQNECDMLHTYLR